MSNQQQVTLFQQEMGVGPSQKFGALTAAGIGADLGDGIRSSYAILSIKASRWRIKYKGNETPITAMNVQTGRNEPVPSLEMVIIKANGFLNKQFYSGKYVEGSNSPPDCYSLDGKVPSAQVEHPQHATCATCPKNQWGSLIGDNGVKQKACRDTKKLAVVPLADIRNAALGGAMLLRVPPSALKDLSTLSDAMKARGFPYNSVAVRFGFDMDASHPKPTFNAIRPLTDDEADLVLEMFDSDSVAAVLADNDVAVDHPAHAPTRGAGSFEQEPARPVGIGGQQAPQAPQAQPAQFSAPPPAQPQAPVYVPPAPVQEAPTRFVQAQVAPPPPGMSAGVVQAFNPMAPPPPPPFAGFAAPASVAPTAQAPAPFVQTPAPQAPAPAPQAAPSIANPFAAAAAAPVAEKAARKPRAPKAPVVPVGIAAVAPVEAPADQSQLDNDINGILAGLSAFTGGK
jgi:hypothetical protein